MLNRQTQITYTTVNMSSDNKNFAEQVSAMLDELNSKDLSSLDPDTIMDYRKKTNPYGRTIHGSDKYLNFSITQIREEYWKKFIISAFVGYLNRMNDEWKVPSGVPVTPVYEYLEDPSKVDVPAAVLEKGYKKTIDEYEFNKKWMAKRVIVKEFLEEMFQFNPDEHVRSGYRPNRADKTRKPINTTAGKLAVSHLKKTDRDFRVTEELHELANQEKKESDNNKKFKRVKKTIIGKDGKKKTVMRNVPIDDNDDTKTQEPVDATQKLEDGKPDPTLPSTLREMLPPHDTFGRFTSYYKENLEPLREFVQDAYCEKPDLELAINPYAVHDTEEEAEAFKKKHRNEVIAEVFTVHCGKWNFFDSFKEQRENVNFYNDNTVILEEMTKQLERDERLGQDLMRKRVQKEKAKNIIEEGPDAEEFKKYREQSTVMKSLGAEHIGDVVDDDCPEDAIQVDVWKVAKGGLELTKDKFYSQSEAPTFVQEANDRAKVAGGMNAVSANGTHRPPTVQARNDNLM